MRSITYPKHSSLQLLFIFAISIALFLAPFLWFKDGQVDMGGDSSRLYFYDPLEYLKNQSLFSVSSSGLGNDNYSYYGLPHFLFVYVVSLVLRSPTALISAFYGLTLSLAFLFVYLTIRELLSDTSYKHSYIPMVSALIASLFYIFPPQLNTGWKHVILTFYQIFLNPLMFFLLLRFFVTRNFRYMTVALLVTVLFSPNFSYVGAPPFFAFYPMSVIFLLLYTKYVKKQPIPIKGLLVGGVLFLFLQIFHVAPIIRGLWYTGSANAADIFSDQFKLGRGLGYFIGIAGSIRVSSHLLALPQLTSLPWYSWAFVLFPFTLIFGLYKNTRKTFVLTTAFFLVALFWVSAKITNTGYELYKALFNVPGFSMFRNFYGQWGPLYHFAYALLLGQALAHIGEIMRIKWSRLLWVGVASLLIVLATPFLRGEIMQNGYHWQSYKVKSIFSMDPRYEEVLRYIRSMKADGKFFILPFSDPGYQVISGKNGGAYEGPSTIAYLTDRQDFSGSQELGIYKNMVISAVRTGNTELFKRLLATLGVRYIFYNADPGIYDQSFPYLPYSFMQNFFPHTQESYKKFIQTLGLKTLYSNDNRFYIYELPDAYDASEVYIPSTSIYFDQKLTDSMYRLALSINDSTESALFEQHYRPSSVDKAYSVGVSENVFGNILKNIDPPRMLHHSFVTTPIDSFIYPLILAKEEFSVWRAGKKTSDQKIDRRLFLSAKRILEIETWGNQMSVGLSAKKIEDLLPLMKRASMVFTLDDINSWEMSLVRYMRYIVESADVLAKEDPASAFVIEQKFLLTEYLLQHQARLQRLIPDLPKSGEEKKYLEELVNLVFSYLSQKVNYMPLDVTHLTYKFTTPQTQSRSLHLLIQDELDNNEFSVFDGIHTYQIQSTASSGWLPLDIEKPLVDESGTIHLTFTAPPPVNIFTGANRFAIETINEATQSTMLLIDTTLINGKGGLIWKFDQWVPDSCYVLSFEYRTKDASFDVRLLDEEVKNNAVHDPTTLFENTIMSTEWRRYQAVVKSSQFANTSFLQFSGSSSYVPLSHLELRNLSLYHVPQPMIVLTGQDTTQSKNSAPDIRVEKVNPSYYRIHVENFEAKPFFIALNERFSDQWMLRSTKGWFVANSYHYEVNRYANAWYIDPIRYGNPKSLDFILETEPQRIFYAGLVVSFIALGITTYLLFRPIQT